MNILPAFSFW